MDIEKYSPNFFHKMNTTELDSSEAVIEVEMNRPSVLEIGDKVRKHSGKPFKKADENPDALDYDYIESFCENSQDPKNRPSAFLRISRTVVSLYQLEKTE